MTPYRAVRPAPLTLTMTLTLTSIHLIRNSFFSLQRLLFRMSSDDADMLFDYSFQDDCHGSPSHFYSPRGSRDMMHNNVHVDALEYTDNAILQLSPRLLTRRMSSVPPPSHVDVGLSRPVRQIEVILEDVTNAVFDDTMDLVIRLKRRKSSTSTLLIAPQSSDVADSLLRFPGKTKQEAWQFC